MKKWTSQWTRVSQEIRNISFRLFLFDVDGTLAPLAPTPALARISPSVRKLLKRLANKKKNVVGIISGRSLQDARRMVNLSGLVYAGNHGLEIRGDGKTFVHPQANSRARFLPNLTKSLKWPLSSIGGVLVENKGLSLSIHYRLVKIKNIPIVKKTVQDVMRAFKQKKYFSLSVGKKVIEIRPRINWNKGSAVKQFRKLVPEKAITVFVGDDVTDEDAFRVLKKKDFGVRIGESRHSKASLYLNSQREIVSLLQRLVTL